MGEAMDLTSAPQAGGLPFAPATGGEDTKMTTTKHRALAAGVVAVLLSAGIAAAGAEGKTVRVASDEQLRAALRGARAGTTVSIARGRYRGGLYLKALAGTEAAPIVIAGRDANDPPVFVGGPVAMHLSDCSHVTLRDLTVRGMSAGGINIDDGGTLQTPSHHITVERVAVLDTGPRGNRDALKLSGVDHFGVRNCRFEGWGGSAIDMVGCHHGVIEDCRFLGKRGFSQSNGVQTKGGSADILIQTSFFRDAGQRAVNLGGSTGLRHFRPRVDDYEATRITVAGNRFVGVMAPIAWVTASGGRAHHNTIYLPTRWVLRILQENADIPQLKHCHDGAFEENLIVFDRRVREFVNIGPKTAPKTFRFRRNAWYGLAGGRRVRLPTAEADGVHQVDPKLKGAGTARMAVTSRDRRLRGIGADAYVRPEPSRPSGRRTKE